MSRTAGVTTIAGVTILGSLLMLIAGLFMLLAMAVSPVPPDFPGSATAFRGVFAVLCLLCVGPAVWGIVTAVGLFRLKNWARISSIVFAVLLLASGVTAGLGALTLLMPAVRRTAPNTAALQGAQIGMTVVWLVLVGLGSWFLAYFTNAKVKAQFTPDGAAAAYYSAFGTQGYPTPYPSYLQAPIAAKPAGRPVSITIIAVLQLLGTVFLVYGLATHSPGILFLRILTGRSADAYHLCTIALGLFVGIQLLRLRPSGRVAAMAQCVLGIANSAVFYFVPGASARVRTLLELQAARYPAAPHYPLPFNTTPIIVGGGIFTLALMATLLYFLITRQEAFQTKAGHSVAEG